MKMWLVMHVGSNWEEWIREMMKVRIYIKKLFENLGLKDDIYNECKERALHLSITELYENTNGHDLCRILGKIFKAKKGDIGEERVRNAMICSYRKSDFKETDLYSKLLMYRQNYNVKYVEE